MSRAKPETSSSVSFIGKLRVLAAPVDYIPEMHSYPSAYFQFKPEDPEFETVKWAIHLGLSILESHRGRQIMAEIGVELVNYHRQQKDTIPYTGKRSGVPECVTIFLKAVRRDFFTVYLTNHVYSSGGAAEAQTSRSTPDFQFCSPLDIKNYKPKKDGGIMMNDMVRTDVLLFRAVLMVICVLTESMIS